MRVLSRAELADAIRTIAEDGYCQSIGEIAGEELHHLTPPEDISTAGCAEEHRLFLAPEGGGTTRYSIARTPYNLAPMEDLDDPTCNLVVMVKPSRSGGTTIAENFLFKMIKFGPMGWVSWYLASDSAVKRYCDTIVKPMFDLHPDLLAKVGTGRSDNNDKAKKISGYPVEWLSASDPNSFTNREPLFMVMDETDACRKDVAGKPVVEIKARQKQLGRRKKAIVMSHPDRGWKSGVAASWVDTSRGIFVMRCAECHSFASAHATKHWSGVPEYRLDYQRDETRSRDERLEMADRTAGMACPHCGAILTDEQRRAMVDEALTETRWMHRGQSLDPTEGIVGEIAPTSDKGYWVHGLMLKTVTLGELAKDKEAEVIKFEATRQSAGLRTYMARQLGEIYEGGTGAALVSSSSLQERARTEQVLRIGECPAEGKFITASIDVGAGKFDVSFRAWDLESRSWWLDRLTLRQIIVGGIQRDIRTRERIEDWDILYEQVIDRLFPIVGRPGLAMPVAAVAIDVGDGNVTWKGREFARRALAAGRYWGPPTNRWARVRLVQGSPNARAPELPERATSISKDELGRRIEPPVLEYSLGVHKLKETVVEWLGVNDGGPGQCLFAEGIESRYFDEYFNERLIDDKWERSGPNESLDLFAYEIAIRMMLKPERKGINWDRGPLPPWATPVPISAGGGDQRPVGGAPKPSPESPARGNIFARFDALSSG